MIRAGPGDHAETAAVLGHLLPIAVAAAISSIAGPSLVNVAVGVLETTSMVVV